MQVSIVQGPDKSDPFDQFTIIAAREEIGGRNFYVEHALSSEALSSAGAGTVKAILEMSAARLAAQFSRVLEESILREIIKYSGSLGFAVNVPQEWLDESFNKKQPTLLPKDILSELEPLDKKRIREHLHVAV